MRVLCSLESKAKSSVSVFNLDPTPSLVPPPWQANSAVSHYFKRLLGSGQ